jgi:hypothetical protein
MTLLQVLRTLRQRLLEALQSDNREDLVALYTTLTVLREIAYAHQQTALVGVLVDMEDAAQEGTMGVKGKIAVPTLEAIALACASPQYQS